MLLLAVQWGGNTYPWKSAKIIGLLVGAAIIFIIFATWQWHQQDEASIPPRIFLQRTVFFVAIVCFFGLGVSGIFNYYIVLWFQVVKDCTPVESGIRFLPMIISGIVISILAGGLGDFSSSQNAFME